MDSTPPSTHNSTQPEPADQSDRDVPVMAKWLITALLVLVCVVAALVAVVGWSMYRPLLGSDYRIPQANIDTAIKLSDDAEKSLHLTYDMPSAPDEKILKTRISDTRDQFSKVVKSFGEVKGKRAIAKDQAVSASHEAAGDALTAYDDELKQYAAVYIDTTAMIRDCAAPEAAKELVTCEKAVEKAEKAVDGGKKGLPEQAKLVSIERAYVDQAKKTDADVAAIAAQRTTDVNRVLAELSGRLNEKSDAYQSALQKLLELLREKSGS